MGGSKSKPIVESARQVLAKRKVDTEAVSSVVNGIEQNLIPYISVWYDPEIALRGTKYQLDENDLSADMVHEMSKWDLFSSTTEGTQVRTSVSSEANGMVKHNNDNLHIHYRFSINPQRLKLVMLLLLRFCVYRRKRKLIGRWQKSCEAMCRIGRQYLLSGKLMVVFLNKSWLLCITDLGNKSLFNYSFCAHTCDGIQ